MKKLFILAIAASALFMGCASSAQTASKKGYDTVTTPADELEGIKQQMEGKDIPCGIGIATSDDLMTARTQSGDEGRTALAVSMKTMVQRYKEQYAKNVSGASQKIWEEKANELTMQEMSGATVYKSITQFNEAEGKYMVFSLVVLKPELFKKALQAAAGADQEFALRAESAEMQERMDAAIAEYKAKFTK